MTQRVIRKYIYLWIKLTANSFMSVLSSRFGTALFLIGKSLRFIFFLIFLLTLFRQTRTLSSYSQTQMLFFFLTFNLIDTATQLFFREVYRFRSMVVSGDFDLVLVKPMSPLFRALVGGADPLDLIMMLPYAGLLIWLGSGLGVTAGGLIAYVLLLGNAFMIASGFHIFVLALAILTTEIDHTVMIYRDLTSMGRVPVDIYREPFRSIITFVIPVGVMMTFPAKALMGLLSLPIVMLSFVLGFVFLAASILMWKYSLSRYASASS